MRTSVPESLLERPRSTARSDWLDLMRALLALWVLLYHMPWGRYSATGVAAPILALEGWTNRLFMQHGETHPAVVMFIVLSGYCIHRNGCRAGRWDGRVYAIKRVLRIAPVYVAASLLGAGLLVVALSRNANVAALLGEAKSVTAGCLAVKLTGVAAFVPSLYSCSLLGNPPLVTVMVEMWLYVVYAIVAVLLVRRHLRESLLWPAIFVVYGATLVWAEPNVLAWRWWHNGSIAAFLPYWWIGAAALGASATRAWRWLAFLGAGVWIATVPVRGPSIGLAELRKLALALVAAYAISVLDSSAAKLPAPLTLFGRSGYSLYAFHAPVIIVLVAVGVSWPFVLAASIGGALVMYFVYEHPLTLYGRTLAARSRPTTSHAGLRVPQRTAPHRKRATAPRKGTRPATRRGSTQRGAGRPSRTGRTGSRGRAKRAAVT